MNKLLAKLCFLLGVSGAHPWRLMSQRKLGKCPTNKPLFWEKNSWPSVNWSINHFQQNSLKRWSNLAISWKLHEWNSAKPNSTYLNFRKRDSISWCKKEGNFLFQFCAFIRISPFLSFCLWIRTRLRIRSVSLGIISAVNIALLLRSKEYYSG